MITTVHDYSQRLTIDYNSSRLFTTINDWLQFTTIHNNCSRLFTTINDWLQHVLLTITTVHDYSQRLTINDWLITTAHDYSQRLTIDYNSSRLFTTRNDWL